MSQYSPKNNKMSYSQTKEMGKITRLVSFSHILTFFCILAIAKSLLDFISGKYNASMPCCTQI